MALFDIFKTACIFTAPEADGEMVVTQHYQLVGEPLIPMTQKEVKSLTNYLRDLIVSDYLPLMSDTITFLEVRGVGISDPTQAADSVSGLTGLLNANCVPYDKTVISRNQTGLRGRSYTGYQQWMAPTELQQNNGVLDSQFVIDMQAFVDDALEIGFPVTERVFSQGVFSKKLDIYTPITTTTINPRQGRNKRRFSTTA